MTPEGVSIIICCYNSESRITDTLKHVQLQKVSSGIPWEVILVNNASTDRTDVVASEVWNTNPITELKIIDEPKPGLTQARICGAKNARYSILSFIDDDNWIANDWVVRVYSIFERDKRIGACGGRIEAVHENEIAPEWFPEFGESYATGTPFPESGYLPAGICLCGAGISIRSQAWDKIFSANHTLRLSGRKGKQLTAGEDAEICMLLHVEGYRLWYDNELFLRHFIPAQRLEVQNLIKMHEGFGQAELVLRIYRSLFDQTIYIRSPWWMELFATLKYAVRANFSKRVKSVSQLKRQTELAFIKGYLKQFLTVNSGFDQMREDILRPRAFGIENPDTGIPAAHTAYDGSSDLLSPLNRERINPVSTNVVRNTSSEITEGISLVICCYNGEKTIKSCLDSLKKQTTLYNLPWEIVIVDNNPKETITRMLQPSWIPDHVPVKIVTEKREGLLHAKLKGYQESKYSLIAYIEDDIILKENWLSKVQQHFTSFPDCGILGGNNFPLYMIEPPVWMYNYIQQLAVGVQGTEAIEDVTNSRGFLWGAGMVIRRQVLSDAIRNGFKFADSRHRDHMVSGVNNEFCWLARISGYRLYYNKELELTHVINAHRMSWINMQQLYRKLGSESISTDFFTYYYLQKKKMPPAFLLLRMYIGSTIRLSNSVVKYLLESRRKVDNIHFLMAWYYRGRMRELGILNLSENLSIIRQLKLHTYKKITENQKSLKG